ncbi:hypothetical protein BH11CYA1_BH11CYA1_12510 [soil metagenome]
MLLSRGFNDKTGLLHDTVVDALTRTYIRLSLVRVMVVLLSS